MTRQLDAEERQVLLSLAWGFETVPARGPVAHRLVALGYATATLGRLVITPLGEKVAAAFVERWSR
jgi:hypothetical protein